MCQHMSSRFRVRDGLPAYGAAAEPFSATGQGLHREGFVVEFLDGRGGWWTGNFQRGQTKLDVVAECPKGTSLVVIAGGQAYVIHPDVRRCLRTFGGQFEGIFKVPGRLVMSNGLWLEATDGEQLLWRSRRISWDGMMSLRVEGEVALGEAYDPMTDEWTSFRVDLEKGEVTGGSYPSVLGVKTDATEIHFHRDTLEHSS